MKIAYLVNQYPKVSHSFIRRELLALEACGVDVARFSIRSCSTELVDEEDKAELQKTQVVLESGVAKLLLEFFRTFTERPIHLLKTLKLALKLGRRSESGVIKHLAYLVEACVLYRWFSTGGIEHVHAHFGTNSTTVAMLCYVLGGPTYSFTVHGPEEFDKPGAIALSEKIRHSAFVVAISSFGQSQLYRWCPFEQWEKIHVVHCGVDDSFLAHPFSPAPTTPRFACVGRLCEQKGQLLLLEAAAQLAAKELQFKLVLVGDGPLRPEIEALIIKYQLQNYVEITGWASSSEVRQHILDSRVMVLPSFAEGLPVVLMEALALYRPVITTYVAGIPELVEPSTCGWLVPPGSVQGLVAAMQSALQASAETLEDMGKLGAGRVAQHHTAAIEAKKLAAIFRSSINASSANSTSTSIHSLNPRWYK